MREIEEKHQRIQQAQGQWDLVTSEPGRFVLVNRAGVVWRPRKETVIRLVQKKNFDLVQDKGDHLLVLRGGEGGRVEPWDTIPKAAIPHLPELLRRLTEVLRQEEGAQSR